MQFVTSPYLVRLQENPHPSTPDKKKAKEAERVEVVKKAKEAKKAEAFKTAKAVKS